VQRLYACLSGAIAVTVEPQESELDLSATMDPDGRRFVLWVVNPHPHPVRREIALESKVPPTMVKAVTVTGPGPAATNSFPRPDHVAPREEILDPAPRIEREFPAWSVTGIEWVLAAR
jgi:alpha-L-arabinofuranosidase